MKNWFKRSDPNSFAQTQKWYIKQIDKYLINATPSRIKKKGNLKSEKKEIMKKIEDGREVTEMELRKISNDKNSLLGSTAAYNTYLIKTL